jgi:hypothetical protein
MSKEVEVMWFIYGIWVFNRFFGIKKFYRHGQEGSVGFNWKEGMNPFVLGWMHSHPDGYGLSPSSIDDRTMRSWVKAKNKSLLSAIYWMKDELWYLYYRDQDRNIRRALLRVAYWNDFIVTGSRKKISPGDIV